MKVATFDEVIKTADFITVHMPLTPDTKGMIGMAQMKQMKKNVRLINCARGGIIVEEDLAEAVKQGIVAGAAIDVFTKEPLPLDHVYMQAKHPERFRFTPHIGWGSEEARTRLVEGIAANIRAWSEGL